MDASPHNEFPQNYMHDGEGFGLSTRDWGARPVSPGDSIFRAAFEKFAHGVKKPLEAAGRFFERHSTIRKVGGVAVLSSIAFLGVSSAKSPNQPHQLRRIPVKAPWIDTDLRGPLTHPLQSAIENADNSIIKVTLPFTSNKLVM